MLFKPDIPDLPGAHLVGSAREGLRVTTADGRPARLAIIDDQGNIVAAGDNVARATWLIARETIKNFLRGQGHLKTHAGSAGKVA